MDGINHDLGIRQSGKAEENAQDQGNLIWQYMTGKDFASVWNTTACMIA